MKYIFKILKHNNLTNPTMENTYNLLIFHNNYNNNINFEDDFNSVVPYPSFFDNSSILKLTMVSLLLTLPL